MGLKVLEIVVGCSNRCHWLFSSNSSKIALERNALLVSACFYTEADRAAAARCNACLRTDRSMETTMYREQNKNNSTRSTVAVKGFTPSRRLFLRPLHESDAPIRVVEYRT